MTVGVALNLGLNLGDLFHFIPGLNILADTIVAFFGATGLGSCEDGQGERDRVENENDDAVGDTGAADQVEVVVGAKGDRDENQVQGEDEAPDRVPSPAPSSSDSERLISSEEEEDADDVQAGVSSGNPSASVVEEKAASGNDREEPETTTPTLDESPPTPIQVETLVNADATPKEPENGNMSDNLHSAGKETIAPPSNARDRETELSRPPEQENGRTKQETGKKKQEAENKKQDTADKKKDTENKKQDEEGKKNETENKNQDSAKGGVNQKHEVCEICRHVLPNKAGLEEHMRNAHKDKKDPKCGYCSKVFPGNKSSLYQHIRTVHGKGKTPPNQGTI